MTQSQYEKYTKYAYRATFGNKAKGEDCLQDAMLKLLECQTAMNKPSLFVGTAIFNSMRAAHRENKKYVELGSEIIRKLVDANQQIDLYNSDDYLVQEAINRLSEKQRLTVETFMVEGTLAAVARKLKVNQNTAKANYRHAMLKIKSYLLDNGYEISNT